MLGLQHSGNPMVRVGSSYNFDRVITDLAGEAIDIAIDSGIQSESSTEVSVTSKWRAIIQAELDPSYSGYVQYGAADRYRLGLWQAANRDFVVDSGYLEYLNQMLGDFSFVLPKPFGPVSGIVGFEGGGIDIAFETYAALWSDPMVHSRAPADALFLTPSPGVTLNVRISGIWEANGSDLGYNYYYLP